MWKAPTYWGWHHSLGLKRKGRARWGLRMIRCGHKCGCEHLLQVFSLLESHVITGYESWLLYSVFVRVLCHRPGQETKTHLIFLLSQGSLQSKWGISSSSSHKSSSRLPLHFTLHHDLKASFGCNLLQSRTLLCSLNHPSHPELCFRLKG